MAKARHQRIFVSYARRDGAELALRLQKDLTTVGCDVWLDKQRIGGGASWTVEIEEAIDRAQVVLALLTPGSYCSEICRAEQLRSLRKGKCVIPLLAATGSDIPLHLEQKNYRNFAQKRAYAESFQFLLKDIKTRKGVTLIPSYRTTLATYITAPPTVANYVERPEAVRALRDVLFGGDGRRAIALTALRGMGGIGKTVLAQALFKDEVVRHAFPDGLVWITVGRESTQNLTTKVREITEVLGGRSDDSVTPETLYRTTIASTAAFVVIDDIWNKADLDIFLAESQRSRFLFTTRDGSIARFSGAREYRVDLLGETQARELLGLWAGLESTQLPPAANALLGECGGLPLALSTMGALLRGAAPVEWADTAKLLHDADLAAIEEQLPPGQQSFFRAIDVSVKSLPPELWHRYGRLAVLLEDMTAALPVLQTLWNVDEAEARRVGRGLTERSLAQRDDEGGIRLHDLQLDYLRAQYSDREALPLIRDAVRLSAHVIEADPRQFGSQVLGRLLPHRDVPTIHQFTDEVAAGVPPPWLRPILPTLDPPGPSLFPPREGHHSAIVGVALTLDGQRAISASEDETLKVWDVQRGRELATLRGHSSAVRGVAVSADGRYAVSASSDKTLKIWDLEAGCEVRTLRGHKRGVISAAMSPDGRLALSASWDATMKLWDLETGVELKDFRGHSKSLNFVAVSADWTLAVSASEDTTLRVWDLTAGRQLRILKGHTADVWGVALTADGQVAASASEDHHVKVWDIETGRVLKTLRGHTSAVYGVAISPDSRFVVSASDDATLRVWDLATGDERHVLKGHSTTVYGVAVSADSRFAVSASYDATLKIWDLESGLELRTLEGHSDALNAVTVSADGRLGVFASDDKSLKVWDVQSGCQLRTLSGHASFVQDVAIRGDGCQAVSASDDGTIKLWDLDTGSELRTLRGHNSSVYGVAVSADWRLAVSASDDKTLKVWNLETGDELRVLRGHGASVYCVAMSADGTRAISASYDATVRIWDVESGSELHKLTYPSEPISFVALTPDGRLGVSASDDCLVSDDGTIKVWEVETGRFLRTIEGHTDSISCLSFSPDGALLVSASWDKTLKVWAFETGLLLATFTCDAPVLCCRFIQSGKLIAGDHLGRVHLLSLEPGKSA